MQHGQPVVGRRYTWKEVSQNWRGEQTFLAKRDGRIVCATLVKHGNPEAPEVMIVGDKPRNMQRAAEFCEQGGSIPIFIGYGRNQWEFAGYYEFVSYATDRATLRRHERISGDGLTRVIYLRRVGEKASGVMAEAELDELPITRPEGREQWRLHLRRERDRELVSRKKCEVKRLTGRLACEACLMEFGRQYGPELEGFCEVHHRLPLGGGGGERKTALDDLAVLCANCHRAIHRMGPKMPSVEVFKARIQALRAEPRN